MEKINESKNAARAGSAQAMLTVSLAVLALAMLGTVLYMQYAEHSYYQASPSVWAGAPASGTPAAPAVSHNLSLPPATTSVLPSSAPAAPASPAAETADAPAVADTDEPPAETSTPDAASDAEEVD